MHAVNHSNREGTLLFHVVRFISFAPDSVDYDATRLPPKLIRLFSVAQHDRPSQRDHTFIQMIGAHHIAGKCECMLMSDF